MKEEVKKKIDKDIRKLKDRILMIVNDRILDQVLDDISDEIGDLMYKISADFENEKLVNYAYGKLYEAILKELIKRLKKA